MSVWGLHSHLQTYPSLFPILYTNSFVPPNLDLAKHLECMNTDVPIFPAL
jgi:hypothetical protein